MPDIGSEVSEKMLSAAKNQLPKLANNALVALLQFLMWTLNHGGKAAKKMLKSPVEFTKWMKKKGIHHDVQFKSIEDAEIHKYALANHLGVDPNKIARTGNVLWMPKSVKEKYFGENKKGQKALHVAIEKMRKDPDLCKQLADEALEQYKTEEELVEKFSKFSEKNQNGKEIIDRVNLKTNEEVISKDYKPENAAERIAGNDQRIRNMHYQGFAIAYIAGHRPSEQMMDNAIANVYGTKLGESLQLKEKGVNKIEFCPDKAGKNYDVTYLKDNVPIAAINNYKPVQVQERPMLMDHKVTHEFGEAEKIPRLETMDVGKTYLSRENNIEIKHEKDAVVSDKQKQVIEKYIKDNGLAKEADRIEFTNNDGKNDVAIIGKDNQPIAGIRVEPEKMYPNEVKNIKSDLHEFQQEKKKETTVADRAKAASKAPSRSEKSKTRGVKAQNKNAR